MRAWSAELPLVGAGGEPVDLWRTILSHGLVSLPPARIDEDARTLEITVPLNGGARTLRVRSSGPTRALVEGRGTARERDEALARVAHMLRLDEDLSDFYAAVESDPDLAWATAGAGRIFRGATVFEDVVKTICTTNCTWSATERMVGALVAHLGESAPHAKQGAVVGRAFPTPAAMAHADEAFYRDVVRAGYRGAYLHALAAAVASGELDLEALGRASRDELPDDEVERVPARAAGRRSVRSRAHHDAAGPVLAADPRLVDAAEVRPRGRAQERQGHNHHSSFSALRPVRRARLLAVPDPRLGKRVKVHAFRLQSRIFSRTIRST